MKSDGRLARCQLKGLRGDAIFAVLCGCGHNIRKTLRYLSSLFAYLLAAPHYRHAIGHRQSRRKSCAILSCHSLNDDVQGRLKNYRYIQSHDFTNVFIFYTIWIFVPSRMIT